MPNFPGNFDSQAPKVKGSTSSLRKDLWKINRFLVPTFKQVSHSWQFRPFSMRPPILYILSPLRNQRCHFNTCFQTRPLESIPGFRSVEVKKILPETYVLLISHTIDGSTSLESSCRKEPSLNENYK